MLVGSILVPHQQRITLPARGVIASALEPRGQNATMAILYLGGVAGVVAFALALYAGGTLRRTGLLIGLGLCLTIAWLLAVYLSAKPTSQSADCSDCGAHFGRWLDTAAIFAVVGGNALSWLVGTIAGSSLRALLRRPSKA